MTLGRQADALREILGQLTTLVTADVVALFREYGEDRDFPKVLTPALTELVTPYAQGAAEITAQWYTEMAPELDFRAKPVVDLPAERIEKTARWALYAPGNGRPLNRVAGAAKRMVSDASRTTVLVNAEEEGVRWARLASSDACAFCRLMSTRGAVYHSDENALKSHDHCRCVAVPERGGARYRPPAYVAEWEEEYTAARRAGNTDTKSILAHMRAADTAKAAVAKDSAPIDRPAVDLD